MVHWPIMPGSVKVVDSARATLFYAKNSDVARNSGKFVITYGKVDCGPEKWTNDEKTVGELWRESDKVLKIRGF